ncbi:MAG: ATP-dependent DNA helicase [Candidatus Thermoplasmatota archaeon]|nr:ATP-dependent DNA helicase [Candidatus Thermoplasmatota archaeon]
MGLEEESTAACFFPYTPRKGQPKLLEGMSIARERRAPFIFEGPTGVGKTVCALSSALSMALSQGKRVLYLTRTNSQQTQVLLELRAIKRFLDFRGKQHSGSRSIEQVSGCGIQGRGRMCPLLGAETDLADGTPEELSRVCSRRKKMVLDGRPGGCKYYAGLRNMDRGEILGWMRHGLPTPEEAFKHFSSMGACPYEAVKEYLPEARVVAAPYVYFFNPAVRSSLLENMRCPVEEMLVVVDEAHNLPDYSRELLSISLSQHTISMASRELERSGKNLAEGQRADEFCCGVSSVLEAMVNEYCQDEEDALVPASDLRTGLMSELGATSITLGKMVKELLAIGEKIRFEQLERGKLPRSYAHSLASFLQLWEDVQEDKFVHLAMRDPMSIEAYCMDPGGLTGELKKTSWSIHMSGTLRPLDEYRDTIGLEGAFLHIAPSPFPPENRLVVVADDVTARYEDWKGGGVNQEKMTSYLRTLSSLAESGRNTAFFFRSYALMEECIETGAFDGVEKIHADSAGCSQHELMKQLECFKKDGGALLSVMGGRLSEGIDFPGEMLEIVVIVGLPFPRPSARQKALLNHYERRFHKGWDYAVNVPMERRCLQAVGRLIRAENDRGMAVFLDKRAGMMANLFDSMEKVSSPEELRSRADTFFNRKS